jgi:hypothetical protein
MGAHRKHGTPLMPRPSKTRCSGSSELRKSPNLTFSESWNRRVSAFPDALIWSLTWALRLRCTLAHGECDLPTRRHAEASRPEHLHPNCVQGRTMSSVDVVSSNRFARRATAVSIIVAAAALLSSRAVAQGTSFGQRLFRDKADCQFCHGVAVRVFIGSPPNSVATFRTIHIRTSLTRREIDAVADYILTTFVAKQELVTPFGGRSTR